jgi:putative ABC transport system permease protein
LLIACANIANLLLVSSVARRREIAVRRAIGATPSSIVRQLLTESLALALLGSAAGIVLASWGTGLLVRLIPAGIPLVHPISVNLPVLGFTAALAILTGTMFGVAPALDSARFDLNQALKDSARTGQGASHRRTRAMIVITEVALATVLLAGAGLLLRSFEQVRRVLPGFDPENVVTAEVSLPAAQYTRQEQVRNFFTELVQRLAALPGAISAGASTDLPLNSQWTKTFTAEGYVPTPGETFSLEHHSAIVGEYLQTMRIPLLRGREFTAADNENAPNVVIVSASIARHYWPNQDPLGKRIHWGLPQEPNPTWLTVVGVVGDVKAGSLDAAGNSEHTYQPFLQIKSNAGGPLLESLNIAVRASGDPAQVTAGVRNVVTQLDPQLAIAHLQTMQEIIGSSTSTRRATMLLLLLFAATALFLSAIGIYGVVAQGVQQRTREFGIRMTLGAQAHEIVRMVLRGGLVMALAGVAIGSAAALALTRLMQAMLFEVRPWDPMTFAAVIVLLLCVAALAGCLPARRAAAVDPASALRNE